MHKIKRHLYKGILFALIFNVCSLSSQTNKSLHVNTQKISQLLSEDICLLNDKQAFNLLFANINYSFNKLVFIDSKTILAYDKYKALFFLIDINEKKILDKYSLNNVDWILKKERVNQELIFCDFKPNCNSGRVNDNCYFTEFSLRSPFYKLNDSTYYIGFLKNEETKYNNVQLNIIVSNNKIKIDYKKWTPEYFCDFTKDSIYSIDYLPNSARVFSFLGKDYMLNFFNPILLTKKNNKKYNYISVLDNNKLSILYNEAPSIAVKYVYFDGESRDTVFLPKNKGYYFISHNEYLYQYYGDTLIVLDSNMDHYYNASLSSLVNGKKVKTSKFFVDKSTNHLFCILEQESDHLDFQNLYSIYRVAIDKKPVFSLLKTIFTNKSLNCKAINDNKLITVNKNPIFNTDYIYSSSLERVEDTVMLDFLNFNYVNALKYQAILSRYYFEKFSYNRMSSNIIRRIAKKGDSKSKFKNETADDLLHSIKLLLENKDYFRLLKKALVFENNELGAYNYFKDNNLLELFSEPLNLNYFEVLKKDIDEIIMGYKTDSYDHSSHQIVYKTKSGRFYTIIKLDKKYYLRASIGYETETLVPQKEAQIFSDKFKYLEYNDFFYRAKSKAFFYKDSSVVAKLLSKEIQTKYFPNVIENKRKYPQNSIHKLFKSLNKCFQEDNLSYMKSQLIIYPVDFIEDLEKKPDIALFKSGKMEEQKELVNLFINKKYSKMRLSSRVSVFKV